MIRTKFVGATNSSGSKIVAKGMGRQVSVSYNHALNPIENHRFAAEKLALRIDLHSAANFVYTDLLLRGLTIVEEFDNGYRFAPNAR